MSDHDRDLLIFLKPEIRWGLMTGKYFVRTVLPLKIHTDREIIDILTYYQDNETSCGVFNTKPRPKEERFMNGINLLDTNWKEGDIIEYDSDPHDIYGDGQDHRRIGKIVTVRRHPMSYDAWEIVVRDGSGVAASFALQSIDIKL